MDKQRTDRHERAALDRPPGRSPEPIPRKRLP